MLQSTTIVREDRRDSNDLLSFIRPQLVFTPDGIICLSPVCLSVPLSVWLSVCLYVCLYDCPLKYVSRDNSKIIQAILIMLMKLGAWTSDSVLIMHVIFFSPSYENCGCLCNENIQNVAKTYGSRDILKTIQATLMKVGT